MPLNKLPQLIDDRNRIQIALALRIAPRKQPMPAQHHAIAPRRLSNDLLQHHAQLKPRPLPRQPGQLVPKLLIELLHLDLPVRRGRQRDPPVRMQMVHMRKRQKPMQRRIDRSRHRIIPKRAQRIHIHHLVFQTQPRDTPSPAPAAYPDIASQTPTA